MKIGNIHDFERNRLLPLWSVLYRTVDSSQEKVHASVSESQFLVESFLDFHSNRNLKKIYPREIWELFKSGLRIVFCDKNTVLLVPASRKKTPPGFSLGIIAGRLWYIINRCSFDLLFFSGVEVGLVLIKNINIPRKKQKANDM